jgi:Uma2 family endonuclease
MMSLVLDKPTKPRVKRWTKREYNDLVDKGAFRGQRLYLFRGELIEMPPMGAPHAQCLLKVTEWLYSIFRPEHRVRNQMPFDAPGESMPEPDAAVIAITASERLPHPNVAMFIIEVSDSSIELDHDRAFEYAAAGVPEYWIVDVNARQIEVYRQIVPDSAAPLGFRYSERKVATRTETIAPLAKPEAKISVADLLP